MKLKVLFNPFLTGILFAGCRKDNSVKNKAPNPFPLIKVADGATDVDTKPELTWEAATDPDGGEISYLVYLDTEDPPKAMVADNLEMLYFNVEEELLPETKYYWKVVAKDTKGNTTESAIASFTIRGKTNAEKMIGKWFFESGAGFSSPLTNYEKKSFVQFNEDLTGQLKRYYQDNNGDCAVVTDNGFTYQTIGNDRLHIDYLDGNMDWFVIQSITNTKSVLKSASNETILRRQ